MILLKHSGRAGLAAAALALFAGCAQTIQPYRGLTSAGADDAVIRKYKFEKHEVNVYIVTITTYSSGGGASTQSYRLYEVAGFNYSLSALGDYFRDSGQPKAAAELAAGVRITRIALPAIYVASAALIADGLGAFQKGPTKTTSGGSSFFNGGYNWGMIGGGAVLYFAGPWLLDFVTWNGYIAPSIDLFNKRLKKDLQLSMGLMDDGPAVALAAHF